ncbi:MAG: hypothetical protein M5R36_25195 [Deltaproteobacteria bacterium]|nr:hypothetical protein [Deltaproteobacteria bacterium]
MADLPVPVAAAGYAGWYDSVGDNWYFFLLGGRTTGFTLIQTVHKYDLDADTWTTECEGLPVVQQYTSSAYDDGYIYAAGGANDDGDALDWFARLPVDDCEPAPTTTTTTVTTTTTTTTIPGDDDTGDDDTGDDDADDDATDDDMDDDADDDASDDDDDDDDDAADDDDDDDDDDDGGCCGC